MLSNPDPTLLHPCYSCYQSLTLHSSLHPCSMFPLFYLSPHYLLITSHHITSHHITSHHITSHPITSHHIPSHPITSHPITSHPIPSHHIISHHIPSHHIISHHITSLCILSLSCLGWTMKNMREYPCSPGCLFITSLISSYHITFCHLTH